LYSPTAKQARPVDQKAQRVEALRAQLLAGLPELRADRTSEMQGRWVLAYMLDWHRREDKSSWWEYFRLCALAEEDLYDERAAVAGMEFVERVGNVPNKKGKADQVSHRPLSVSRAGDGDRSG
jgi:uncharacterized protein